MKAPILALAGLALAAPAAAQPATLHIEGWARATVPAQKASAAYLLIHNRGTRPDRLLSASTPAAAQTSLHSTSTRGGVARMRAVGPIPIPAGQRVEMKPGGLHVMLIGLRAPLRAGQKLPLTLRFERAGVVRTTVSVRSSSLAGSGGNQAR